MIEDILKSKYGKYLKGLDIYENRTSLILSRVVINDESKGEGIGTKIMEDLVNYADKNKQIVALTPSSDFGGNKNRLTQFYKRFGFKHNKGSHKNYEFRDTMIRHPNLNEGMKKEIVKGTTPQREFIKKLVRENIDLSLTDETPDTMTYDIYYNKRKAGNIICGPAAEGLGEDTKEIVRLYLEDEYTNLNVANQAVKSLWKAKPDINRFVVRLPNQSHLFWEKLGFQRLNDTFHMLMRGH